MEPMASRILYHLLSAELRAPAPSPFSVLRQGLIKLLGLPLLYPKLALDPPASGSCMLGVTGACHYVQQLGNL